MLKKKQRVGSRLFDTILEHGTTRQSAFFSLRAMPMTGNGQSKNVPAGVSGSDRFRLAIAVPKKTSSKAVKRHQIKRRATAIVQKLEQGPGRGLIGGWTGILFVKTPAAGLSFQDFEKELVDFLERSGVIKSGVIK
jgi:ribonuclease P protein component